MASLMVPPGYRPVPLDRCPPEVRAIIFKEVLKATKPMEEALRIQGNRNTDGVAPSHEENGSDEDQGSDKEGSVVWDDPLNTEEIIREFTSADRHKEKGESLRLQLEWIDCNGGSRILNSELLHINRATTTEVLSWLLPLTLFKAWTPMELERLGRRMTIQIGIMRAGKSPTWNVEVEMGTHAGIDNHWKTCEGAHGADGFVLEVFEEWMRALQLLPPKTLVILRFSKIWRDFQRLRELAIRHGLPSRHFICYFPRPRNPYPDYDFCQRQMELALRNRVDLRDYDLSRTEVERLESHGCRGFPSAERTQTHQQA
ncbi:hypothetical protein GLAREA_11195 [Glarea lozoyensis ATCC 20868]|uniref:Uncharacterized protein n=1 Tax=Glarea lozoyensis (strain ATCC 20868 / MF5171) TaxID=1116229 RepID=S3DU66_GLAL2|nr:uncharacterized protein GLAREA_11195 [Glarea lozoyensis ATCC 20868]EPE35496.1 hypothetical protein GLAREA_11195 [Glarea lozoyensis ATCC 20868]